MTDEELKEYQEKMGSPEMEYLQYLSEQKPDEKQGIKMNCKEIIIKYLKKNNYDGLCNEDCGCGIEDDDLICCGENFENCVPAIKKFCKDCKDNGKCEVQFGFEIDYCFQEANND